MDEVLTLEQIHDRYAAEWVLLVEPETSDTLEVSRGRVAFHSKDRDEVYRRAIALGPKRFAMLFTGDLPANTAVVL